MAFATVYVIEPVATTKYPAGVPGAVVSWQDDQKTPSLAMFGLASISIYVGNAIQQTKLQVLSNSTDVSTTSSITFTPDPTIGPDGSDYFIRFESLSGKDSASAPFEAFSAKFTLTGMTGNFSASVQAEIAGQSTAPLGQTSSGTAGPTSTPSLTTSTASKTPTSTSSTSATATATSGAMSLNAGWAGIMLGAIVGVTMF